MPLPKAFLHDIRVLGLTRTDGPAAGLPDDFHMGRKDIPSEPIVEEAGRGLPAWVLRILNDNLDVARRLFHGLLRLRVKPYYLYQADLVVGTAHFRTPVSTGLEIIEGLRGHTSGYAVPTFAIDVPGGGGKIAVLPNSTLERDGDHVMLTNYEGQRFRFPDPVRPSTPAPARVIPLTEVAMSAIRDES